MKLFHSSHLKLSILEPRLGGNRHEGEDPQAINQPVIYFTNTEDEIFSNEGIVAPYKYIVEIEEEDPDLYLDEKYFELIKNGNEAFPDIKNNTKWYFLKRPIKVVETLKWDGKKYVK
jgi:hypothetical protein